MEPACARDPLISAITTFLARDDAPALAEIRESLEREIDAAGPGALGGLSDRLAHTGGDWTYYPPDPLARRIHHVIAERILEHNCGRGLLGVCGRGLLGVR